MLLWDIESKSWGKFIDRLSSDEKKGLSLKAIELCFESFRPSFEELFDVVTVSFLRESISVLRQKLAEESRVRFDTEFYDDLYGLEDEDPSPGVASLVQAVSICADAIELDMSTAVAMEVMSACYEAMINAERIPIVTVDAERDNVNLVRLIRNQWNLIQAALGEKR